MPETDASPHDLWLGKPAPRYTSYPPATAFHDGMTATDYAHALESAPPTAPFSLYLHILFCRHLCLYCGCHTAITHREDRISAYVKALIGECDVVLRTLRGRPAPISQLHFGGGTPNSLAPQQFSEIIRTLERTFDLSACHERAVELDPRFLTRTYCDMLAACGITRVSLGVQDFDLQVQEAIGRVQPYDCVAQACDDLRAAGITAINFDLMYGLPRQSVATIVRSAEQTVGLNPSRIALFSYAHVPRMKRHQKALEAFDLPDARAALAMENAARAVLEGAGYVPIGMDHFALPDDSLARAVAEGRLHRNFQGYTEDTARAMISLGASAISETPMGFFQNEKDERRYGARIAAGELATVRGLWRKPEDSLRGEIIRTLMCTFTCDIAEVAARHHADVAMFASAWEMLAPFFEVGIIAREGDRLSLTTPHRMAMRVVARAFDSSTPPNALASRAA